MSIQALTNGIRGYTTKVRLRGLTESQAFNKITRVVRYTQRFAKHGT